MLLTAPTRLVLEATSRAITVIWTATTNHQSLVYHVNYSSPLTGQNSTTTSDTTLTLTGLHLYAEYTISVQAGNEEGLSVPVTGTARTGYLVCLTTQLIMFSTLLCRQNILNRRPVHNCYRQYNSTFYGTSFQ